MRRGNTGIDGTFTGEMLIHRAFPPKAYTPQR
jgi:hypothetical protein